MNQITNKLIVFAFLFVAKFNLNAQSNYEILPLDTLKLVADYNAVMPGDTVRYINSEGYWTYEYMDYLTEENLKKGMKKLEQFLELAGFQKGRYFYIDRLGDEKQLFTGFYNVKPFYHFLISRSEWRIAWGSIINPLTRETLCVHLNSVGTLFFVTMNFGKSDS